MPDMIEKALLVVFGAVLGILLPPLRDLITRRFRRPNVTITVGNGGGFIYDNVLIKTYANGGSTLPTEAIFVRVCVLNVAGKLRNPEKAEGCIGYLAALDRWDPKVGYFVATTYRDFLRLEWSFNRDVVGMDLLPGVPNWLDVCYVLPCRVSPVPDLTPEERRTRTMHSPPRPGPRVEPAVLKVASNPPVHRYGSGFDLPGLYRVKVQVSGTNFEARFRQFYILIGAGAVRPEVLDEGCWRPRLSDLSPTSPRAAVAAPTEAASNVAS